MSTTVDVCSLLLLRNSAAAEHAETFKLHFNQILYKPDGSLRDP